MARIRSVGGIATIQGGFPDSLEPGSGDLEFVGIYVRLFAKTDGGMLAIDPHPQTYLSAISHVALRNSTAGAFEDLVRVPEFLHPEIEGRTQAPWGGVIEDLRRTFGIETDAETLQSLDFELLMDAQLRQALARLSE